MKRLVSWFKNHPLAAFVAGIILYWFLSKASRTFLGANLIGSSLSGAKLYAPAYEGADYGGSAVGIGSEATSLAPASIRQESAPTDTDERMVVTNTSLSMVVKEVRDSVDQIVSLAIDNGGYMVTQRLSQPEEAPYAELTVRVESARLEDFLNEARNLAVKVTMEQVNGTDVTDQYEDLEAKIVIYQRNMAKFDQLMTQTEDINYLLQIQRELINLQNQIDNLKGRQKYLEQTAKLAKVSFNLSSDEWSLPYAPAKTFRPNVIFKQAVRALVTTLRGLVEKLIWIAVYSVIWGPVLILFLWFKRRQRAKDKPTPIQ